MLRQYASTPAIARAVERNDRRERRARSADIPTWREQAARYDERWTPAQPVPLRRILRAIRRNDPMRNPFASHWYSAIVVERSFVQAIHAAEIIARADGATVERGTVCRVTDDPHDPRLLAGIEHYRQSVNAHTLVMPKGNRWYLVEFQR